MNELFAAPASGLPFLSIAFAAHADDLSGAGAEASHFFRKEVFAAPASGLPFLSIAFASQLAPGAPVVGEAAVCASATLAQKKVPVNARISLFIAISMCVATCLSINVSLSGYVDNSA
jgi:hypothetical protein